MLMLMRRLGGDRAFRCPRPRPRPPASAVEHLSPGRRSPDRPPTDPREPDRATDPWELLRDSEPE